MIRSATILAVSLGLAACASNGTSDEKAAAIAKAANQPAIDAPAEGLPPQQLKPGECGLFLWNMTAPRRFVFFTEATSGSALVLHEGQPVTLFATETGGDVFGQFFTETDYLSGDGRHAVRLTVNPGEMIDGGQRVETGRLVTLGADGWETVLPVTGVRACIPG